jgi:hypothetical protein
MKRSFLFSVILVIFYQSATAQELFMPRDIQAAFKKGTRSMDGRPGKNYWQNRGRYSIDITAMPPDRTIRGKETITYFNNSPDTIRNPSIKLFLNIHKPGAPRNGAAGADYLTEGVSVDQLKVNGENRPFNNDVFTNTSVRLPKPLAPHDSVQLDFEWHYNVSVQSGREGMIDSTTFFLAYFYPRVAVFDDYNGWDRMTFMDSHEFYSDFNDYTVRLHVPKNFVVWGTGTLQHPELLLLPAILERFNRSFTSGEVIRIATAAEMKANQVTTQNAMNTWEFRAREIPDMAFGLSDHFAWDGTSVVVDDRTKRRASAQAVYNDTAADYRQVAGYAAHSLDWLSHNWPGIPYPYEKTTVFQGYAGMEYPMMANDESYEDTLFSRFVAEHEIAHTYMPFYMGINETRYGFMDEGWATTFELLIGTADLGKEKAAQFYKQFRVEDWMYSTNSDLQVPIVTPGDAMTGFGFGTNEYGKASLGYLAMKDLLGDDMFKKCLQEYMNRWHGKHPIPWDFFHTFNDVSGKNLNWFWNNWFFGTGYIDYALQDVKKTGGGYSITVKNIGGFFAPADLTVKYTDGTTEVRHLKPDVWQKAASSSIILLSTKKAIASLSLDGGVFVDADPSNNEWDPSKKGF